MLVLPSFSRAETTPPPPSPAATQSAVPEVAICIVYDTSGSMTEKIKTKGGTDEAKHVIGRRALAAVGERLKTFNATSGKQAALGVVVFNGKQAAEALPLETFDSVRFKKWLDALGTPHDATPLGEAIALAGKTLAASKAPHRHLIVITDGISNAGMDPGTALRNLRKATEGAGAPVFTHCVALDTKPANFATLEKEGASVIGANDETQLQSRLNFIIENKILLELE